MEAGLVEIVRSVNRCWIYDSYFNLYEYFSEFLYLWKEQMCENEVYNNA